jgi:hypothetical protein
VVQKIKKLNRIVGKENKMIEWISAKISSFIGGILGGLSILSYIPPKDTKEAFMRGGVSVGFALMFAQPILLQIGLEVQPNELWMYELGIAFLCGFVGYSVMNWVANFLAKNQNKDIMEIGREIKNPKKKKRAKRK